MSNYKDLIENMTFSFSRLNSFYQCPYQFYLTYIKGEQGENNFYAEYGSHVHSILEKFSKGESEIYELPLLYEKGYSEAIKHKAPPNKFVDLNQSYFESGLKYFQEFEGFGDYEIVAVEKEVNFNINNIKIKGFIDLLVKDKEGNYHIIDHKSSDPKSAKSEKAQEYFKQMTLYSIGVHNEYGKYPIKLHINAFRKQQWFTVNFDEKEVEKIKQWVIKTVDMIKKEEKWLPYSEGYFCNFLCNFRNMCEYRPQEV